MANVIFKQGTRAQYDAIAAKDANTLYWLTDTQELFKGDALYGKGTEATTLVSGLMSAADKAKLDALASGGASGLTAVDSSVILAVGEDSTTIGVQVSKEEGNALELKTDGLFVSPAASSGVAAGDGISVADSAVSIKLNAVAANGLTVSSDGLSMAMATATTAGAMSAEDKAALDDVVSSITWGDLSDEEVA